MITALRTALRTSMPRLAARLVLMLTLMVGTLSTVSAQTVTYFHNDIAGTPMLATNAAGAVVWKENYLPYGYRQVADPASSGNKLWFTGKAYDPETQLSYMGARYYMPLLGRFTGIDPVGLVTEQPHSFNRYAYANNNPYKFVDPDGKSPVLAFKVGLTVLAIAGAANYLTAERQAHMVQAGALLKQRTSELLDRASGLVFSEGANSGDEGQSKPPPDTVPIDGTKWSGDHQNIKGQSGAGAADNTRVGPSGEVWVQQPSGSWVNTGNANDMIGGSEASGRRGKDREPSWKQDRGRKQRGDW